MILDDPKWTKERVIEVCDAYWNPGRTRGWHNMGIDIVIGRREGYYFWDMDGTKFMNLHLNGGTFNLGHRNPVLIQTLAEALTEFDIGNHHFPSMARAVLAEKVHQYAPDNMKYTIFSSCGGEAVDVAIKAVRSATQRKKIVSLVNCYHGHTGLALGTGHALFRDPFCCPAHEDEYAQVPLNDIDAMEQVLKQKDVAGVIIETIPATYGFPIPKAGYLKAVKTLCEKYGSLYIVDEVQTGLMRSGKMWAIEYEGFQPDVIVTGKGFGGGIYPMAATIMSEFAGRWTVEHGREHTSTFGGSEAGCIVSAKVLDICAAPETQQNVLFLADYMKQGLDRLRAKYPDFFVNYTQRGVIMGLEFNAPEAGKTVMRALYHHGIWAIFARLNPRIVQFKLGLLCDQAYCDELFEKLDAGIAEAEQAFK